MVPPAAAKADKPKKENAWSPDRSAELYGVDNWGHGFFGVNKHGHVTVKLTDEDSTAEVSLFEVIEGLRDRGTDLPVLLRFRDLLHSRIRELNESFRQAIKDTGYKGEYRGVMPIKPPANLAASAGAPVGYGPRIPGIGSRLEVHA